MLGLSSASIVTSFYLLILQLDMNDQLFGEQILSLAETDVPPEDLVFHKFYMNKMKFSKKLKKKKKRGEDDVTDELLAGDASDDEDFAADESDNEEIENTLDSSDPAFEEDGDYDYNDLDKVADESCDELIDNPSDDEGNIPSDISDGEQDIAENSDGGFSDDVALSDDQEDSFDQRKRKQKSLKRTAASPFANLEDYEHLLEEESPTDKTRQKEKVKKKKKKKTSR